MSTLLKHKKLIERMVNTISNSNKINFLTLCLFLLLPEHSLGEDHDGLSLQGYSGLINTPHAFTTTHGVISTHYSNQVEIDHAIADNNNLVTSIGILPFAEIGGRIAWFDTQRHCYSSDCQLRDLSANIKIRMPFIPEDLFSVAVGQQDIGGQTNTFATRYVVASKSLDYIDLSLGWGQKLSHHTTHLDGFFSGIEYKPVSWAHVIIEDDSQNINLGLRLITPENYLPYSARMQANLVLHQFDRNSTPNNASAADKHYFTLGLQIPLGKSSSPVIHNDNVHNALIINNTVSIPKEKTLSNLPQPLPSTPRDNEDILKTIFKSLNETGFERVRVGTLLSHNENEIVITFENTLYSHNELDAINKAVSIIKTQAENHYQHALFILKKEGLSIYHLRIDLADEKSESGAQQYSQIKLRSSGYSTTENAIHWYYSDTRFEYLKPRITLSPALSSAVATEFGVWDYSAALDIGASVALWPGASIRLNYTEALDQSDDFDVSGVFSAKRQRSAMKNYGIQQSLKIFPQLFSSTFIGLSNYNYLSVINETAFFSHKGQHKVSLLAGHYEDTYQSNILFTSYVGQYRYYLPLYNLSATISAGQFFEQDTGYRLDFKFWFEDKAITLFYKNTGAQFLGLSFSTPLTTKRALSTPWMQLNGNNHWTYSLQTQTGNERNTVNFGSAIFPFLPGQQDHLLFNEDRLNPLYLIKNEQRIRNSD